MIRKDHQDRYRDSGVWEFTVREKGGLNSEYNMGRWKYSQRNRLEITKRILNTRKVRVCLGKPTQQGLYEEDRPELIRQGT